MQIRKPAPSFADAPTNEHNWIGGYYEAALLLGHSTDEGADDRLKQAILALWLHQDLTHACVEDLREWSLRDPPVLADYPVDQLQRIYGVRSDARFGETAFTSVVIRESESREDWLDACVPLGGYPIPSGQGQGYPFGSADDLLRSSTWRRPLEEALARVVLEVAETVPIKHAVIGFEISGEEPAPPEDLAATAERGVAYVVRTTHGYQYLPTTAW